MRPVPPSALIALHVSTARAAQRWARWLIVLLVMFDLVGAPWHGHRHDSGLNGTFVAAVRADAVVSEIHAATHAQAIDERSSWAHATTALRIEAGPALTAAGDNDDGPVPSWPAARLRPAVEGAAGPAVAGRSEPPPPVHRSLPPAPQAPPRRA